MIEHEGKTRYTYSPFDIAEKLLPHENDIAAVAHNKAGAEVLRQRLPEARRSSVYVPGNLLASVAPQSAGNLSGIVAEAIYNPHPPLQLSEDEMRAMLKGALIFDIAWLEKRAERPGPHAKAGAVPRSLPEHILIGMRTDRLEELKELSPMVLQPQKHP